LFNLFINPSFSRADAILALMINIHLMRIITDSSFTIEWTVEMDHSQKQSKYQCNRL
jgi:hypothetical protein